MPERRRLFLAFWPDHRIRQSLDASRQRLFPLSGRPVDMANLHLTAAFLGEVPASRIEELLGLTRPVLKCRVELDRLEFWGKRQLLVASASQAPPELSNAVDRLWAGLGRLGFSREPRPFKPHVTLARQVLSLRPGARWPSVVIPIDRWTLVESVAGPGGIRYQPVVAME